MKFYMLSDATFYDSINTIHQFVKSFLDKNVYFFFQEYGAFKLFFHKKEQKTKKNKKKHILWVLISSASPRRFYWVPAIPSRHTTSKWRRINVDATWSRHIDVDTTSF